VNNPPPNFRSTTMNTHPMMAHEKMRMADSEGYGGPGSPTIKSFGRSDNGRCAAGRDALPASRQPPSL
jgi:hypothetical protein